MHPGLSFEMISWQRTAAASVTALWFKVAQQPGASAHGNQSERSAQTALGTLLLPLVGPILLLARDKNGRHA